MKLTIGALQDVELDATLEYVAPKSTESNGVILFEVKAAVQIPEGSSSAPDTAPTPAS